MKKFIIILLIIVIQCAFSIFADLNTRTKTAYWTDEQPNIIEYRLFHSNESWGYTEDYISIAPDAREYQLELEVGLKHYFIIKAVNKDDLISPPSNQAFYDLRLPKRIKDLRVE